MSKNTSILLGDHFEAFVAKQVKSGKFTSVSEVIRSALRLFEFEEAKNEGLINELKKGERAGFVADFDRNVFMSSLNRDSAEFGTADSKEGTTAFVEKRKANFVRA